MNNIIKHLMYIFYYILNVYVDNDNTFKIIDNKIIFYLMYIFSVSATIYMIKKYHLIMCIHLIQNHRMSI